MFPDPGVFWYNCSLFLQNIHSLTRHQTCLQTERLIRHNESATAMDVEGNDDQDSSTTFQLDKIGKILNTRVSAENVGVVAAADAVTARLQEIRSSQPDLLDTDLPRILAALPELNPQQKAKLAAVEEMLFKVVGALTGCMRCKL
jgi:hypothetical protein